MDPISYSNKLNLKIKPSLLVIFVKFDSFK